MKTFIKHIRHPFKPSQFIGTVAVVMTDDGGLWGTGWSQCHPTDLHRFSRKQGTEMAAGRALSSNVPKDKEGNTLRRKPFVFYNPDGSKRRADIIGDAITGLLARLLAQVAA